MPSRGRELSEAERQSELREQADRERSSREVARNRTPWWKFWTRRSG